jgi:hypothetical protein
MRFELVRQLAGNNREHGERVRQGVGCNHYLNR